VKRLRLAKKRSILAVNPETLYDGRIMVNRVLP